MQKELTISIDEQVYHDLHQVIGPEHLGQFIESLDRPRLRVAELEAEALDWTEALVTDVADALRG